MPSVGSIGLHAATADEALTFRVRPQQSQRLLEVANGTNEGCIHTYGRSSVLVSFHIIMVDVVMQRDATLHMSAARCPNVHGRKCRMSENAKHEKLGT